MTTRVGIIAALMGLAVLVSVEMTGAEPCRGSCGSVQGPPSRAPLEQQVEYYKRLALYYRQLAERTAQIAEYNRQAADYNKRLLEGAQTPQGGSLAGVLLEGLRNLHIDLPPRPPHWSTICQRNGPGIDCETHQW